MTLTFLDLPAEIRMIVYHEYFPSLFHIYPYDREGQTMGFEPNHPHCAALLRVCHKIHDEVVPVLYSKVHCQNRPGRRYSSPFLSGSRYTKYIGEAFIDDECFSTIPREEPDPSSAPFVSLDWLLYGGFPNLQRCTIVGDYQGLTNASWFEYELRNMQRTWSRRGRLFKFQLFLMFNARFCGVPKVFVADYHTEVLDRSRRALRALATRLIEEQDGKEKHTQHVENNPRCVKRVGNGPRYMKHVRAATSKGYIQRKFLVVSTSTPCFNIEYMFWND